MIALRVGFGCPNSNKARLRFDFGTILAPKRARLRLDFGTILAPKQAPKIKQCWHQRGTPEELHKCMLGPLGCPKWDPFWHPKKLQRGLLGPLGGILDTSWTSLGSQKAQNPKSFLLHTRFGTIFGAKKGLQKGAKNRDRMWDHFWDPSGHNFGPFWDLLLTHFGTPLTSKATPVDIAKTFKNHGEQKQGF